MSLIGFEEINHAKADLSSVYHANDPRQYFRKLRHLDYRIAQNVKKINLELIRALAKEKSSVKVLDIGCSYGVNAALLAYGLSMETLYGWWSSEEASHLKTSTLIERDLALLHSCGKDPRITFVGLDASEQAIEYALGVGLLDDGIAINLEEEVLPQKAEDMFADVDLVITTGCVGYVTERTFEKIFRSFDSTQRPWVGAAVLRMFPYDEIARTLQEFGYTTQKLAGAVFAQRRFEDGDERDNVLSTLKMLGLDAAEEARQNSLLAEYYLSRPSDEVSRELPETIPLVDR